MVSSPIPTTTQGWQLNDIGQDDGYDALTWNPSLPIRELGPTEVLVEFSHAALNFRDIAIIRSRYPFPTNPGTVPGSDAVGTILAIGHGVSRFSVGDAVVPFLMTTGYFSGSQPLPEALHSTVGSTADGMFRCHGVFDQDALVRKPANLTMAQAGGIMGVFTTAWNCFYGGGARSLRVGDTLLVQGSGGQSLAALQLAHAAGAQVIATTSSDAKVAKLKELGATHVINYRTDENWGAKAKTLSVGGRGCDFVIDVVGTQASFRQCMDAVAPGGQVLVVGFLENDPRNETESVSFMETLVRNCSVRGILTGSRQYMEEAMHAIEVAGIQPVNDERVFGLEELKEAYQYLERNQNFGKVIVKIDAET